MWYWYSMDSGRFDRLMAAFQSAKAGSGSGDLEALAREAELPDATVEEAIADSSGALPEKLSRALLDGYCRADAELPGVDLTEVRDALVRLLMKEVNGCRKEESDPFLPPAWDGKKEGQGRLGAIAWLSRIMYRGSPIGDDTVPFVIRSQDVPELFGELSPTEVKRDDSEDSALIDRFYEFVESLMVVGDGGYQVETAP